MNTMIEIKSTLNVPEQCLDYTYSPEELNRLREFVDIVKHDDSRSILACWGNHSDYSKGY